MSDELKPCPFCGENNAAVGKTDFQDKDTFAIGCRTRRCHGVIFALGFGLFPKRDQAVKAWNRRSPPTPPLPHSPVKRKIGNE